MKHLKKYESFLESVKLDKTTLNYINGDITDLEFENYLFSGINENLIEDAIKWVKEKVLNIIFTFIKKINDVKESKMVVKFVSFLNKIIDSLKKFREKHPTLTKVIMISIIVIIVLMLSSESAHAAEIINSGGKSQLSATKADECNAAIGFIETHREFIMGSLKEKFGIDNSIDASQVILKAESYIKHIQNGTPDFSGDDKAAQATAKTALKFINDVISESNKNNDVTEMNNILKWITEGTKHVFNFN